MGVLTHCCNICWTLEELQLWELPPWLLDQTCLCRNVLLRINLISFDVCERKLCFSLFHFKICYLTISVWRWADTEAVQIQAGNGFAGVRCVLCHYFIKSYFSTNAWVGRKCRANWWESSAFHSLGKLLCIEDSGGNSVLVFIHSTCDHNIPVSDNKIWLTHFFPLWICTAKKCVMSEGSQSTVRTRGVRWAQWPTGFQPSLWFLTFSACSTPPDKSSIIALRFSHQWNWINKLLYELWCGELNGSMMSNQGTAVDSNLKFYTTVFPGMVLSLSLAAMSLRLHPLEAENWAPQGKVFLLKRCQTVRCVFTAHPWRWKVKPVVVKDVSASVCTRVCCPEA